MFLIILSWLPDYVLLPQDQFMESYYSTSRNLGRFIKSGRVEILNVQSYHSFTHSINNYGSD